MAPASRGRARAAGIAKAGAEGVAARAEYESAAGTEQLAGAKVSAALRGKRKGEPAAGPEEPAGEKAAAAPRGKGKVEGMSKGSKGSGAAARAAEAPLAVSEQLSPAGSGAAATPAATAGKKGEAKSNMAASAIKKKKKSGPASAGKGAAAPETPREAGGPEAAGAGASAPSSEEAELSSLDGEEELVLRRDVEEIKRMWGAGADKLPSYLQPKSAASPTRPLSPEEAAEVECKAAERERLDVERETGEKLFLAAKAGELERCRAIVKFAAEEGLDVVNWRLPAAPAVDPAKHWSDCSPFMAACRAGHLRVARYFLLELKADAHLWDLDRKMTALMLAAEGNNAAILELLRDVSDHNATDALGRTALMIAAAAGNREAVEQLLWKSDVNAVDRTGCSALTHATLNGEFQVAKKLCDFNASVDVVDSTRRTPLMHAARWGFGKTVRLLLDRGADVDRRDKMGWTPLMLAARYGKAVCVEHLLDPKKGRADPSCTERVTGRNALMLCVAHTRNLAIVDRILATLPAGFDLRHKDIYGKTALDLCDGVEIEAAIKDALKALDEPPEPTMASTPASPKASPSASSKASPTASPKANPTPAATAAVAAAAAAKAAVPAVESAVPTASSKPGKPAKPPQSR
jgi:ankyrin repeat protein